MDEFVSLVVESMKEASLKMEKRIDFSIMFFVRGAIFLAIASPLLFVLGMFFYNLMKSP